MSDYKVDAVTFNFKKLHRQKLEVVESYDFLSDIAAQTHLSTLFERHFLKVTKEQQSALYDFLKTQLNKSVWLDTLNNLPVGEWFSKPFAFSCSKYIYIVTVILQK